VLLHKLEWFRLGGETSDRPWGDVLGAPQVQAGRLAKARAAGRPSPAFRPRVRCPWSYSHVSPRSRLMRLHRFAVIVAAVTLGALTQPRSPAADPARDTSLKLIPDDASFYSASLHLGEQIDRFRHSNAYAKLKVLPAAQAAAAHLREAAGKSDNPLGHVVQLLKDPANKDLADLLTDLPRQEIFVYGGANWARMMPILLDANWAQQLAPLKALMAGETDTSKAQGRAVLHVLNASADKIETPELVIGFKLSNSAPAVAQIKRLEGVLTQLAANAPEFKNRIRRTKVAEADALTVTLDGSLVPLDRIPWSEIEQQEGDFQKLRLRLKAMTVTIALLVKDDYLLLTIGPNANVADNLGRGTPLANRPELAPLAKFAGRELIAISYGSQALAAGSTQNGEGAMTMLDTIKDALDKAPLSDARRSAIDKDLKQLFTEVTSSLPKPGATVAFSFLTDRGQESYGYNYGTTPRAPTPKPLTLLDHIGGSPLMAFVSRENDPTTGYRWLAKWAKTFYGHVEGGGKELADQFGQEDAYKNFQQGMEIVKPFLKKFDEITGDEFLPALGEGEAALVLDAKWTSKQWAKEIDQEGKDLPMLEVGVVRTVADAGKLVKAFQAYRDLVNSVFDKVKEFGGNVPVGGLPKPESKKVSAGTAYYWPVPADAGLDSQVQPNFALSDAAFAVTLSLKHTERLLTPTPLKAAGGPLAEHRPAVSAAVVDFAGFVAAARPWVEQVAVPAMLKQVPDNAPPGLGKSDIPDQVKTVMDVLGCLRRFTSVTYRDGGATVTHSELVIRDLK
jgi:hypothetical protein